MQSYFANKINNWKKSDDISTFFWYQNKVSIARDRYGSAEALFYDID